MINISRKWLALPGAMLVFFLAVTTVYAQEKNKDASTLYESGEKAFNSGDYKEATRLFNECLHADPAYADAYSHRGATREILKDLQGAHTDYNIYLELRPEDAEITLARGILRYKLGFYEAALTDFRRVLILPPGETRTLFYRQSPFAKGVDRIISAQGIQKAFLLNEMGLCETKLNRFTEAIQHYDSAIALEPGEPDYYVNRGIAREGNKDPLAASDYQKALTLNPTHSLARHNLAVIQGRQGDKKASEEGLNEILDSDSTMLYTYIERAYQRLESGYFKGALDDYSKALQIDSSDTELWINRGLVKEKLKDLTGAYADYSQAIRLNEDAEKAWLSRGNVLSKLNRFREAIDDYTVALSFHPDYAMAYYNRGLAYSRLKQSAKACEDISKAIAMGMTVEEKVRQKICSQK